MNDTTRVIVSIGNEPYRTEVQTVPAGADGAGGGDGAAHSIIADEPKSLGGTDQGANPFELLLASIGACKAITVRMYADRKGWPLERLGVRLDLVREEGEDGKETSRVEVELEAVGELTDEQRSRLVEIADKCPVHKLVASGLDVRTRLVEG